MSDEGYNEIKIRVTSTSDQVTADWEKVKAKGKELGDKTIRIPVEASDPVTEEWRRKVQAAIKSVGKEALKIPMDPNSAEFRAEVASTLAELRSIAKEPVPLEMADADKFRASVEAMVETVRAEVRGITVPVTASRTAGDVTDLSDHQANDNPASLRPAGMVPAKITIVGDPYADVQKKIGQEPEPVIPIKALDPIDAAWVAKVQAGVKAAAKESLKIPADPQLDAFRAKLAAGLAGVTENLKAGIPLDLTDRALFRAEAMETVKSLQAELKLKIPVEADTSNVPSSAKAAGGQMSGLILAAVAGGLAAGGPAIGGALVGVTGIALGALGAYLQRGDPAIQAGWQKFAADAKSGAQNASQVMVGPITNALGQIDSMVVAQEPLWKSLFSGAGADVPILTGGLVDLANNALPGLDHAMANSTGIAKAFAKVEGDVGGVIGDLGDSIAKNSSSISTGLGELGGTIRITGRVLDDLITTSSNLATGVLPVLNGSLNVVEGGLRGVNTLTAPITGGLGGIGTAALVAWLGFKGVGAVKSGVEGLATGLEKGGTKMVAWGAAAETTSPRLARLATSAGNVTRAIGPGGILGVAAAAAVGLGIYAAVTGDATTQQEKLRSETQSLTNALQASAGIMNSDVSKALIKMAQDTNDSERGFSVFGIRIGGAAQSISSDLSTAGVSMGTFTSAVESGGTPLAKLEATLNNEAWHNPDRNIREAAQNILSALPGISSAFKTAQKNAADLGTTTGTTSSSFNDMAVVQDTAARGFANLTSNMADATSAESDMQKATSALVLELQLAGEGGMQKANDAIRKFANDLANDTSSTVMKKAAGDILDASGALDNFSQRGRDVAKILEDSQSTWAAYATGAKQAGVSTTGMTTELNVMRGQLEKTLEGMGLTKAQADKLITSFDLIPQSIATSVTAPGAAEAFTNVTDLANELKALPPGQSVTVTGITSEAEKKLADLGYQVEHMPNGTVQIDGNNTLAIQSALNAVHWINGLTAWIDIQGNSQVKGALHMQAAGGPSSGPSIIHDQGPEAVRLPTGSMVMPHANTNIAMKQAAAAAQTPGVLELRVGPGADSAAATFVMNLVRSGNIQLVANGQRVQVG